VAIVTIKLARSARLYSKHQDTGERKNWQYRRLDLNRHGRSVNGRYLL
jgi:hypothetical protein